MHYCQYGIVNTPAAFRRYLFRGACGQDVPFVRIMFRKNFKNAFLYRLTNGFVCVILLSAA